MNTPSDKPERRAEPNQVIDTVTILLVDDRPENLLALEATLKCREYRLLKATSGEEALAQLEVNDVGLVLLDIQMPGMDGYETASRIKNNPALAHIPVMMVTAIFKEEPHVRRGYEVGVVDYIGKPFDIDVLRKKVGIYTQLHQHRMLVRRTAEQQKLIDAELTARSEELEHRSAQITTLLESIAEPVFVVWRHKITESNTAAVRLFGYDGYDEITQGVDSFLRSTQPRDAASGRALDDHSHPYFQALKGEKAFAQIVARNVKTGDDIALRCSAHPVRFGEDVLGVVMMHQRVLTSGARAE